MIKCDNMQLLLKVSQCHQTDKLDGFCTLIFCWGQTAVFLSLQIECWAAARRSWHLGQAALIPVSSAEACWTAQFPACTVAVWLCRCLLAKWSIQIEGWLWNLLFLVNNCTCEVYQPIWQCASAIYARHNNNCRSTLWGVYCHMSKPDTVVHALFQAFDHLFVPLIWRVPIYIGCATMLPNTCRMRSNKYWRRKLALSICV